MDLNHVGFLPKGISLNFSRNLDGHLRFSLPWIASLGLCILAGLEPLELDPRVLLAGAVGFGDVSGMFRRWICRLCTIM